MIGVSTKTIYGVAALYELGSIDDGEVLKIKEIASRASLPQNFLEQILLSLKKDGILTSIKGAYGGYKLAKSLQIVTLKDVMMALESDAFVDIDNHKSFVLEHFWRDINSGFAKVVDIPLSQLKDIEQKSEKIINYTI